MANMSENSRMAKETAKAKLPYPMERCTRAAGGNDKKHGIGVLTTATGEKYEGEWQEDKYIEDKK